LEFKIVHKPQFTLMGKSKRFNTQSAYAEIPEFWREFLQSEEGKYVCGEFGVCWDCDDNKDFSYYIADSYVPWNDIPRGMEILVIPEGDWAVFPCRGAWPNALQKVNTKIWNEWLPSQTEYKLSHSFNLEYYSPPCENPQNNYGEIWIPIEKIKV